MVRGRTAGGARVPVRPRAGSATIASSFRRHAIGSALLWLVATGWAGRAHTEVISPRRLVEVVDLSHPTVSPDGRVVAFRVEQADVERNTYDTAWYVQPLDGSSAPHRVADGGSPLREYGSGVVKSMPAVWSPDGRWIYFRAQLAGQVAVWRAATDGSGAQAVTSDPADVRESVLSADGRTLTYSVGATRQEVIEAEQAENDHGIHIDDRVFIGAGLFRSSVVDGRPTTQRFIGDWFATGPLMSQVPDRWREVDLVSLEVRDVPSPRVPSSPQAQAGRSEVLSAAWHQVPNPVDGRIAILMRVGSEEGLAERPDVELAVLPDAQSRQPVRCDAQLCRGQAISDIQWSPDGQDVIFTVTDRHEGRAQSIFRWNLSTGDVRLLVQARGLLRGSSQRPWDIPCGHGRDVLVCVAAEADSPPRLEKIDLANGIRQVLFEPNAALASDIAAIAPAQLIRWKDIRGREFTGQLFEAQTQGEPGRRPLFVTFYTCDGFLRGGLGDEWPLATLAEQGISALCINGLPGQRLDIAEHYGQGLLAVESVVELLSTQGRIDRSKVGMGGLSYGSEATTWTAMHSNLLAAASVASPSITPTWYLFNSLRSGFRTSAQKLWKLGEVQETPDQWQAISPTFNVERFRAPILFQLPEQEYLVALDYALPLVRQHHADLYVFPGEPHIKVQPRHKLAVYGRNLDWFRFWLQGHEDPDPTKARQYAQWRTMREARRRAADGGSRGDGG